MVTLHSNTVYLCRIITYFLFSAGSGTAHVVVEQQDQLHKNKPYYLKATRCRGGRSTHICDVNNICYTMSNTSLGHVCCKRKKLLISE